jgi:hypothetical protein
MYSCKESEIIVYIDQHTYKRLIQRKFIPYWLSMRAADEFVLNRINQTIKQVINEYDPGLIKIVTPGMTIYQRKGHAKTIVKNKVRMAM